MAWLRAAVPLVARHLARLQHQELPMASIEPMPDRAVCGLDFFLAIFLRPD